MFAAPCSYKRFASHNHQLVHLFFRDVFSYIILITIGCNHKFGLYQNDSHFYNFSIAQLHQNSIPLDLHLKQSATFGQR